MKIIALLLILVSMFIGISPITVSAEDAEAEEITDLCVIHGDGKVNASLSDDSIYTYAKLNTVSIGCEEDVYGVYVKFDREPLPFTVKSQGGETSVNDSYLHQYFSFGGVKEIELNFSEETSIADIYVFSQGETPSWVQKWETADKADIMICPTHSDDDQLYFAGMLPWCAANGYTVQVVYLTNHLNTHDRPHELLEGIWQTGVKYYPLVAHFPDLYSLSLEDAISAFKAYGYEYEDFTEFYVEVLGRYKPLVVAGHDENGEYGHGAHMLNFKALTEAVEIAARDGIWDVPKTYIHSWKENTVTFNWDEPLEYFDGKSAFNVSQEAFDAHKSQHRFESLTNWLYGTESAPISRASQIRSHSPCRYGLYRSTVGLDTTENGLFEHLRSYKEQADAEESSVEESLSREESYTEESESFEESVFVSQEDSDSLNETTEDESSEIPSAIDNDNSLPKFAVWGLVAVSFAVLALIIKKAIRKNNG